MTVNVRQCLGTLAACLSLGLASGAAVAQDRALSFASALPDKHIVMSAGIQPYFERVAQQSGGTVKWEMMSGGVAGGFKAAVEAVRDSLVDGAVIVPLYTPAEMADSMVLADLGLMLENPLVAVGAFSETVLAGDPRFLKTYEKLNILPLGGSATAPYHMMCRTPVSNAASIRGKRFWASGPWGIMVRELGGTPVNVSASELYEALQRGQVDCVIGPVAWLKSFALWDVVKVVTRESMGLGVGNWALTVNLKTWKGLSPKAQEVMASNLPFLVGNHMFAYVAEGAEVLEASKAKGVQTVALGPDVVAMLDKARAQVRQQAIDTGKRRGVEDSDKIVEAFFGKVAKWEKIVADAAAGPEHFSKALDAEVYSKMRR